jgi:hypothetical protein
MPSEAELRVLLERCRRRANDSRSSAYDEFGAGKESAYADVADELESILASQGAHVHDTKLDGGCLGCLDRSIAEQKQAREQAARERLAHLRERLTYFGEAIEARAADLARPKGGMQVPFHGDFASAPPSVVSRLRWWHRDLLAALDAAERSRR